MDEINDLLQLSDHAWQRLRDRMAGLMDEELHWRPAPGDRDISLDWRLNHIASLLTEERNAVWLGQKPLPVNGGPARTAVDALQLLDSAYDSWRKVLARTEIATLSEPIGSMAGRYGTSSRRSYILHVLDELIHHGAEAALLRDLYGRR